MITVYSKWVTIMTTMLADMLAELHILNSTRVLSVHKKLNPSGTSQVNDKSIRQHEVFTVVSAVLVIHQFQGKCSSSTSAALNE